MRSRVSFVLLYSVCSPLRMHNSFAFIFGCGTTLEVTEALLSAATVALGPSMKVELDAVCIRLRMFRILRRSLVELRSCDCLETDLIGSAGFTPRRTGQLSANEIMACNAELQAFRFIDGSCIRTSSLLWWLFGSRMMTCRFLSFVCLFSYLSYSNGACSRCLHTYYLGTT